MEILTIPFRLIGWIYGMFMPKPSVRKVHRIRKSAVPQRQKVAAKTTASKSTAAKKPTPTAKVSATATTQAEKPNPAPEAKTTATRQKQGTLYKGVVSSYGTATCDAPNGSTYRSFVVRLKDRDGTEQELRGVDLQLLVDAGKITKGKFVKILSTRKYLGKGADGRNRGWKNLFSVV